MVRCWQRSNASLARWTERPGRNRRSGNVRTTTRAGTARLGVDLPRLAARSSDADVDEQPRSRGGRAAGRSRRLRRHGSRCPLVGRVRCDRADTHNARRRRDVARAVRQTGRCVPHPRVGAAGVDRQLQSRAGVGQLGGVPATRGDGPDDVRADDRRIVDLHRHPGNPAGHLRVLRRDRAQKVQRLAGRHDHADGRARWHGRRATVGGDDEWRRGVVHRRRCLASRSTCRDSLPRRGCRLVGGRDQPMCAGPRRQATVVRRPCGQCGDPRSEVARDGFPRRHRHGSDQRARSAELCARRPHPRRHRRVGAQRSARTHPSFTRQHGVALPGDGRVPRQGERGLRLRQQLANRGKARRLRPSVRLSGFPSGLHPSTLLRGQGSVQVGCAVGRSCRHRGHRSRSARGVSR